MLVFKFGGASVKDVEGVKNLKSIIQLYENQTILVVVSAMGKMTNTLEEVVKLFYKKEEYAQKLKEIEDYHQTLINGLFEDNTEITALLKKHNQRIKDYLENVDGQKYDEIYDQVISNGELISTLIISTYLNQEGVNNRWLDARKYLKTDATFREAKVNWEATQSSIDLLEQNVNLFITQGFIGGTSDNKTTTLGREGSDYTASIFAHCLRAESVTIWKDVPGVLSADPRLFSEYQKFDQLSYTEAVEMTYYGATVIHPKTIKPLQNSNIPLFVKPFLHPEEAGTVINSDEFLQKNISAIIIKKNQLLISISTKDFSFISELNISHIYEVFAKLNLKCNVSQNSALSFTVCLDYDDMKFEELIKSLETSFKVRYNENVTLYTIRHYDSNVLQKILEGKTVILEQLSRSTAQIVVK
ncbi:aspartate kinase [Lacihabitans sp. CCS-44]|uniref:aspartate kinase n=1 Tax=Lacihabitans sp. CCS-44 TaxID=2487331 RepID=UPI0020CD4E52|nr:aspartate kinase [Lacihabitans sp. CCS-44]MCP9753818.1 aspartate kinase [Lacihabitans sp. CCS-44]